MKNKKLIPWLIASLMTVSCSKEDLHRAGSGAERSPANDEKVVFYVWADYTDPQVFETFSERTGIPVEVVEIGSTEEMLANMQSQPERYDVLIADDITVSLLRELSLIRELDRGKLTHFSNIDPRFRGLQFDRENKHSVPYMWGSTLVAYRKDKIPNPEKSWSLLWNPDYARRIMMIDEVQDIFGVTLLADGRSADADDPESIRFATEKVMEQIRNVDVQFGGFGEVLDGLKSGEVWAAMNYSGDVAGAMEDHPEIDFFIPKEGALLWLDNFVISRDSKNADAAHKFIDFMMEAEVAAANSNFVWYASPNKAAEPYLDEELLSDERLYPTPEVMAKCQFPTPEIQAKREHLLNLAMRDIRKLRREKDAEAIAESEVVEVGESIQ